MMVRNTDQRSGDYDEMRTKFRPSHADYTYKAKYGVRAWEGGGRASARETIGRVAAGVLARKALAAAGAIEIVAWVQRVQDIETDVDPMTVTREAVDANIVRCPDAATADKMIAKIDEARKARRLAGRRGRGGGARRAGRPGRAGVRQAGRRAGQGDAVAARRQGLRDRQRLRRHAPDRQPAQRSLLRRQWPRAHAEQPLGRRAGRHLRTARRSRCAWRSSRPPPSCASRRPSTRDGHDTTIKGRGRHDPCVLPRAVPIVEAMVALVLADHFLRQRGQCG